MTSDLHPFGSHFRLWRERRGYSLKEAAGDIITPQFLSQFERGQKSLTIDKLSRLLISIGVDWADFLSDYTGERVSFALFLLENKPLGRHTSYLKESLSDYYQDNPDLKSLFLEAQKVIDSSDDHIVPQPPSAKQQYLINKVMAQEFPNVLEYDFLSLHRYHFTLDYILTMAEAKFEQLEKSIQLRHLDAVNDHVLFLANCVAYLHGNGFYEKCQDLIDDLRDELNHISYLFYCDFFLPRIFLEGQQAYLWFRQNLGDKAIPKAREILELYDNMYQFSQDPYLLEKRTNFLRTVNQLNKTGLSLYD